MAAAVQVSLLCCLLHGVLCQQWLSFMPQSLEGLSGSCVTVPCTFTMVSGWDSYLDESCVAMWMRGWNTVVFHSGLTPGQNILQGKLTGNLHDKDCTTVFDNLSSDHNERYYFRLQCNNDLKNTFQSRVLITTRDDLPKPVIAPSRLEVKEGSPVRLTCSTVAPCAGLPPALTWTPMIGDIEESVGTTSVTSVLNFTASYRHDARRFSCSALHNRQAGNGDLVYENSLTLRVLYPPHNTLVSYSGPVTEGSSVSLTCNTNANPAADRFTWYRVDGDQVTKVGWRKRLSTTVTEEKSKFYCQAGNNQGDQNSATTQIDVRFPPKETTVIVNTSRPVLEGSSVSLLCRSRANPNVTRYTWYKGGDEEEETEVGSSFVVNGVAPSHSGDYSCKATNELGDGVSPLTQLDVQYPPRNTSVSVAPSGPVRAGSSVTLTCTSIANPAEVNITWFRVAGGEREAVGSGRDLALNVTKLSEDRFYCQALNVHGAEPSDLTSIDVTFAPEILTESGCVKMSSGIQCSCDSQGNPPPSLIWELSGEAVNHSSATPIQEVPLGSVGTRSVVTLNHLDEATPSLVCVSFNSLGSHSFAFDLSSSEPPRGLHALSLFVGSAVGAVGMLLVCVPLLIFFCRKRKIRLPPNKRLEDTSDTLVSHGTNSSKLDVIYANKATLEEEEAEEEDPLHYANVDFAKLRTELGGVEIRGLDSMTAEYAEIHLHSRGDAEEEEAVAGTHLGKGESTDGLIERVSEGGVA